MRQTPYDLSLARKIMDEKGITQKVIAEALSLTQSAVSNIFNGKRSLKFDEARRLDDLLGLRISAGNEVPLVKLSDLKDVNDAKRFKSSQISGYMHWSLSPGSFAVEVDEETGVSRFEDGAIVYVDAARKPLYGGKPYLVQVGNSRSDFMTFMEGPARFVARRPGGEQSYLLGDPSVAVIGRVEGVVYDMDD